MTKAITYTRGFLLVAAQVGGAILASFLVQVMFPVRFNVRTTLSASTSIVRGVFIEAILTAELVFTVFMLAKEKHKATYMAPVGIGLALFIADPGFSQSGDLSSSGAESEGIDSDVVSLVPDNGSILSVSTLGSIKTRLLPSTNQLRSALIYKGAAPRPRKHKAQVLCALCNEHLGSNVTEVRAHLEKHSKQLDQDFSCKTCQIIFAQERDLTLHETSAAKGECGFVFDHAEPCNGHHPPDIFSEMLTDDDRLQFAVRLQHWEQAQLKLHLAQVNEILQEQRRASMDDDCWSFGGMLNSLVSLSSALGYQKPRSALEPGEPLSRLDRSRLPRALANFDTRRKSGNPALAAFLGDRGKIKQMVTRGADINAMYAHKRLPNPGFTPLQAAVEGGGLDTLKVVIQLGAITSMQNKSTLLALASCIKNGRINLARFLLEKETNINDKSEACTSLLIQAVCLERSDMAQMLLNNGTDANTPHTLGIDLSIAGYTLGTGLPIADCTLGSNLSIAVSKGDYDMVQLLLYHGADVPAEPERSRLLDEAAEPGGVKLLWLLSQYAVNSKFARRRQISCELEMTSSTDGLVASASSVPAFTKDSRSEVDCLGRLLIHAISLNRLEVVEALL